jgi:hypothetical protein
MSLMLVNNSEFVGGIFQAKIPETEDCPLSYRDCVLFPGHIVRHRVTPITKGTRYVLIVEFWDKRMQSKIIIILKFIYIILCQRLLGAEFFPFSKFVLRDTSPGKNLHIFIPSPSIIFSWREAQVLKNISKEIMQKTFSCKM